MFIDPYDSVTRPLISRNSPAEAKERARLNALRLSRADDLSLQQPLDRIATCAAVSFGAPLGAVSLVGVDDVTLAGMHGFERRSTPRAGSFCDEIIRLATRLRVADAFDDPRFSHHEFVAIGGVRAYAGAPIRSADGEILGAVGAFSGAPNAFQPEALNDLEALAHMVELLLARIGPVEVELPRLRRQGWIGVRTLDANRAGTGARAGLVILSVARRSPAEQVGLRVADILDTVDDQILRERADLVAALAEREPGSSVRITFQRAGQWLERSVPVATKQPVGKQHGASAR